MPLTKELLDEINIIKMETRAIVNKIFELGNGDIAKGTVAGFQAGVIDIPFAPSKYNKGKVLPARDNEGAVRILECGSLPFNKELKDYHREKIEQRAKIERRKVSFQMVIDDIYAIGKGRLVGRPR